MKKVFTSAVCIIPPETLWTDLQSIRKGHDKSYIRWPPHLNLLYPFLPEEEFPDAVNKLAKAVESIVPFSITLEKFGAFPHGTVFCDPVTKPVDSLHRLHSAVEAVFPYYDEQSSAKFEGFRPHLTVGQVPPTKSAEQTVVDFLKIWDPIDFTVDRIYVIARRDADPFHILYHIYLGDGRVEKVDIPYVAEPLS